MTETKKYHKQIVIVNQDAGYLTIDIANSFCEAGFKTSLITGRLVLRSKPLCADIQTEKIVKYNRNNYLTRLFSWIWSFIQIIRIIKLKYPDAQLLIITNPPLSTLLPIFVSNKFSILIFDYYVNLFDNLLPWKRFSIINYLWKKMHLNSFRKADSIFVLTEGMKTKTSSFSKRNDVEIMELWADDDKLTTEKMNDDKIIDELKIQNKFVITYSGNIGFSSGVENMINIAELLLNEKDVLFLIFGEGTLKANINNEIKKRNLKNCILGTWQDAKTYSQILLNSSMAYVSLKNQDSNDSIPSKLFTYIAHNLPVICIADSKADISVLINKNQIGKSFTELELHNAAGYIKLLKSNKIEYDKIKLNLKHLSELHTNKNASVIINKYA
ncbi:MAG: glycosyltransferase family 4 protein [Paludibacter sp.]